MRTFVAIDLDKAVRRHLEAAQGLLKPRISDVRWIDPGKIHLTLKFLGEIPDAEAARVSAALAEAAKPMAPFEIGIGALGVFPPRGAARVVWIGVTDESTNLAACHAMCERALERIGYPKEGRAFHPHLTLGRVKSARNASRIRSIVGEMESPKAGTQEVSSLVFYQSTLTDSGPVYNVLSRHAFGDD